MALISVTRLRARSVWLLAPLALHSFRSLRQVKTAAGFIGGSLLVDRGWAFWTMTAWTDEQSMRNYMTGGAHRAAMPHLLDWCDQASVVHWEQPDESLPSWPEADRRMRQNGRPSRVRHPSPEHAGLAFAPPRVTAAGPIRPTRPTT